MSAVYFDYQGKFPPNEYRYIVEVSKKNGDGVARNPIELRITASSILLNGLSAALAAVPINSPRPVEIEKTRVDKMIKEQVFGDTDGAIYKVI
jgi:hypothetical protein